jgi:hypothetical protein
VAAERLAGRLAAVLAAVTGALALWPLAPDSARAIDEIQVYNAAIAEVGQWSYEQHLNYTWQGLTQPQFPGGFIFNHSLQGTPEFAYGLAEWWELGFYLPFAVTAGDQFLSNAAKIRSLFVVPNADKRGSFYGINFELAYETPPFSPAPWALEIRPIIGVRNKEWEFIVNPIVDVSFGAAGEVDFAPALRLARNLGEDRFIGVEYYENLGEIGNDQIYAVTDFKVGDVDVELGIGYGLTRESDRWVTKAIIGYAFPVPGQSGDASNEAAKSLSIANPFARVLPAASALWTTGIR